MSEAYSGLRKRRKRTHPSKCPCCITDQEVEPENEATVVSENAIGLRESRQSKRKRLIQRRNDEAKSESESKQPESVAQKTLTNKRKLRNSIEENQQQLQSSKKAIKSTSKSTGKCIQDLSAKSDKRRTKAKTKKGSYKPNIISKKELMKNDNKTSKAPEQDSDEDIKRGDSEEHTDEHATSKGSKSKVSFHNIKIGKSTKSNAHKAKPRAKLSKEIKYGNSIQEFDHDQMNAVKKTVYKPIVKRKLPKRLPIEKPSLALTKTSNKTSKGSALPKVTQLKIAVFDDLYSKLKLIKEDIPMEEAAEMLTAISCENLQIAYKSSQVFEKSEKLSGNTQRPENKGISDTEEIVSQAAEALVSFRVKSPISREDTSLNEKNNSIYPSCSSTIAPLISQALENVKPPFSAADSAVQALMQIQCSSSIPFTNVLNTPSSITTTQNNMRAQAVLPTVTLSQSFPQLLQPNLATSFTNLMPMVSSHGTLPSFSQIAAQLRSQPPISGISNTIPTNQNISGVTPSPLITPTLSNQPLPSPSIILPSQTLLQPQLHQPVSLSSLVTSCKTSLTTVPSNTVPSVESNKVNTQKQNQLQQPLKGLEEVIGNVGTNVSPQPILWNIKSPVVFLGSPQNLGGVPRNLVTSPSTSQSGTSLEKCGYRPVAPKPLSKPDNSHVTSAPLSSVPNVLTLGGRPILPRTQPQAGDDNQKLQTPQSGLSFVPQLSAISPPNPYQGSTLQALTQVTSANPKRTTLMSVNLSNASSPVGQSLGTFLQQNMQPENSSIQCSSPSAVSAKQAVKKLVHERTKSAELKKEVMGVHTTTKLKTILPLPPKEAPISSVGESTSKNNEFNLEQAATALLSIGVPDGIETIGLKQGPSDPSKDDYEEDVVFTSKGTFRVGDVDVDPRYNRIGREGYTCGKCNKIFTSLSYLARHIKRVCPDMSCRKWKCTLCDKAFRHPFGLQQHVYTHTGERPHKCPLCPKAFYSSNDLRRHSRIHSGERPYRCKHCDKSFATTISLKTHTYIHTGEKPHKCPQCPKTFATSSKLGRHIVTHSEQRPYSCDQCPKSFNRSGDLRRHNLAVHDGKDKSFDCDVCSATFTKSADLRRHSATIHQKNIKTLQCEDCNTQFTTPLCLKMHRDTYHKKGSSSDSEKAYTCDVCGKTYSSTVLLTKHKVTHQPSSTSGYNLSQFQHIAPKPTEQITNDEISG